MVQDIISVEMLRARLGENAPRKRRIVAIVGPPGSGKSTVAEWLVSQLNAEDPGRAAVFPMDGFHYDDGVLEPRGWRPRKGAPHTFDVAGFTHCLKRLRDNREDGIAVPVFDRDIEISRAGGRIITGDVRQIVVEGNYLLLDQDGWRDLRALFDMTVMIDVPEDILRARLEERWSALPPDARRAKLEENDLPNARLVMSGSLPADLVLDGTSPLPA